jgi:hypothetical protein
MTLPEGPILDPWGTPYRVEINGEKFRIIGAGSDRKFEPESWTTPGQYADLATDVVADHRSCSVKTTIGGLSPRQSLSVSTVSSVKSPGDRSFRKSRWKVTRCSEEDSVAEAIHASVTSFPL